LGSGSELDRVLVTYEIRLAAVGARIWERRERLLETLADQFREVFAQIHGPALEAKIMYRAHALDLGISQNLDSVDREALLLRGLAERRPLDLLRKTTSVGPHRDDFAMTLADQSAAKYASQGQSRALVLAFKIAELQTSRAALGYKPILLLDDVSSELDPKRTDQLFAALANEVDQCVLTTTSPRYIPLPPGLDRSSFAVENGVISADSRA
jgi:DNA replication and repair protein RecF